MVLLENDLVLVIGPDNTVVKELRELHSELLTDRTSVRLVLATRMICLLSFFYIKQYALNDELFLFQFKLLDASLKLGFI